MSDDYARIKSSLDIKDVIISASGLVMKKKHLEQCPFCEGHECFSIMENHQAYKCHQCAAKGDVFTFIEAYHSLDKAGALRKAAELANIKLSSSSPTRIVQQTIKERIFMAAADFYNLCVHESPGMEYFVERRGHDERLIKEMKLGHTLGAGLKAHLLNRGYSIEDLVSSGLVKKIEGNGSKGDVHLDFFPKGCAIFPHFDSKGRIIHFTQKDADIKRAATDKKVKWQLKNEYRDKAWQFYNQRAISSDSVVIVEGENDALAVMSAGHKNVMAIIGQISEPQLKFLKDNLKHKTIYLWLDVDGKVDRGDPDKNTQKRGTGGRGFTEKICKTLRGAAYHVRIIEHPGDAKDPDEYLQGYQGKRHQEVQRLLEHSIDYVKWQLKRIGEVKDISEIILALKDRKMFSTIAAMPRLDRMPYLEALKSIGLDEETIKEQLEVNRELRDALGVITTAAGGLAKADPYTLTRVIYEHFEANGKFFRDREHNVYLLYHNTIYEISNNRPFNALMDKSGGLLVNRAPGPQIWEALANRGYNHGKKIDIASWLATEERRRIVYVNFNAEDNTILKISAEGITEVPNGLNEDDILLKASSKISPMEFNPGISIKEGLEVLQSLILDNMTCDREQRYLIICWALSAFLLDFMPYQAIMKFSGASASGKTTAAKLLSKLLYGQDELGHVSSAAAYSLASQNPLVILDNLEENDRNKSLKMFLFLCATGGSKEKRAGGTDSDTVQEKPKSLVLITAIEPMEEAEMINRTLDIEFNKSHRSDDFIESSVLREIGTRREDIISAILKLIQSAILPDLEAGIKRNLAILKGSHKGHSKDRADEYLALLMLILEKLLPHMPLSKDDFTNNPGEIWAEWLKYQNRQAEDDETQGNSILRMLDGLAFEYEMHMRDKKYECGSSMPGFKDMQVLVHKYQHPHYMLEAEKTEPKLIKEDEHGNPCDPYHQSFIIFTAPSNLIVAAMGAWCRDKGVRNPYESASRFTKRLMNDETTLKRGGWEILKDPRHKGPYSKIIKGTRFITLVKSMER